MGSAHDLTGWRVAFFRNMNLGQRRSNSPTSAELLDAFADAGVLRASNFQTNGTVIFAHSGGTQPARAVVRTLRAVCGYRDEVVVRSARWVVDLAERVAGIEGEICLYNSSDYERPPLPWEGPEGLIVTELDHRHAVVTHAPGTASTLASPVITNLVGVPVTVRGIRTIRRLAARLSSPT